MTSLLGKCRLYTSEAHAVASEQFGVYTAEEASQNRAMQEPYALDRTEHGFFLSQQKFPEQVRAGIDLAGKFDFSKFRKLGDIGGVAFLQAHEILKRWPHLEAVLTDYDQFSLDILAESGVFRGQKLAFLNAEKGDFSALDDCDVITMWAVEFALTDIALVKIFEFIRARHSTLILAALTHSPFDVLLKNMKGIAYELIGERRIHRRFCGWLRSPAYLRTLITRGGCKVVNNFVVGKYDVYVVTG